MVIGCLSAKLRENFKQKVVELIRLNGDRKQRGNNGEAYDFMLFIEDWYVIRVNYATESENRCTRCTSSCDCQGDRRGKNFRSDYDRKNFPAFGKLIPVLSYNLFMLQKSRPPFFSLRQINVQSRTAGHHQAAQQLAHGK